MNREKHKLPRRILALLLTLAMFVTMFPTAMFAENGTEESDSVNDTVDWSISKSKTVGSSTLNDEHEATVTLSLPAADYKRNVDVVLVLDDTHATSSIFTEAADNLLEQLASKNNLNVSVGVIAFDAVARDWMAVTSNDQYSGLVPLTEEDGTKDEDAITAIQAAIGTQLNSENEGKEKRIGGTNTEYPVAMATDMLEGRDSEKYIVMFSDLYGYVYRGDLTVDDVTYTSVPMSKVLGTYTNGQLTISPTKYDSWKELKEARNVSDEAALTKEDCFYRMQESYWSDYWSIYYTGGNGSPELTTTLNSAPRYPQYNGSEPYDVFTPFEKSSCLTYDNVNKALEENINVVLINNDYNPEEKNPYGINFRNMKNEMLDDLDGLDGVTVVKEETTNGGTFDEEQVGNIFNILNDTLIQVVDKGSYVVDEMGSGTDDQDNSYDFNFVNDISKIKLTVNNEQLSVENIEQLNNGATAGWTFGDDQFYLYYFANGTTYLDKEYKECFVWEINEAVTKDKPVQLSYNVRLTNPQEASSQEVTYTGLKTNNTTDLYYTDTEGNLGGPEPFTSPEVQYTVPAEGVVSITPADITIYMGGNDGYEAVVGEGSTNPEESVNSLPSPLFLIESGQEGFDPEKLVFSNETQEKSWTVKRVGYTDSSQTRGLYELVPGSDSQDPVRVQYLDGETAVVSDEFEPTTENELYKEYGIELYYGGNNPDDITATYAGQTYAVKAGTGTLTVRAVDNTDNTPDSNPVYIVSENQPTDRLTSGTAAVSAPSGTAYTLNNTTVPVEAAGVGLLFDGIIDDAEHDRTGALIEKVDESMGAAASGVNRHYQAQYLDLVDENNGNAWVKASGDVTVTWAYPEGTNRYTDFTLYHFAGLHRDDEQSGFDLEDLADVTPEEVNIENTSAGITFDVSSGGFSPFVLVWEEQAYVPGPGGGGDDDDEDEDTPALNTKDHYLYIEGYPEDYRTGEYSDDEDLWPVKPQGNITRAEVATVFYRLLKDEVRDEVETDVNSFTDVNADDWFNITVSSLANMGIIAGYEDGSFRPNAPITRAEFAAIAARFFENNDVEYNEGLFEDITGDEWYADIVAAAVAHDLISGYPDGTMRPMANITRAEACAIVNRTIDRRPHDEHLCPVEEMRTWPDNQPGAWYYADMQEATNGHYYEWIDIDGSEFEEWTEVDKDYDWTKR